MPDIYLRELKYSHCLSSFFLCAGVGRGGAACETRRFCCLVVIKVIEINFITLITPIHHHPCSANPYRPTPVLDSALRAASRLQAPRLRRGGRAALHDDL